MYGNNTYQRNFSQQNLYDQIDYEINNLQQMKEKMKNNQMPMQPTNLTQNFQLAPVNREVIRYANSLEDVQKDMVVGETPYFSKDLSVVWIKALNGNIRSFELTEIIPKDEKDIQIELLRNELDELRKEMKNNDANVRDANTKQDTTNTEWDDEPTRKPIKEDKPTSVQRISTSKKR